MSTWQITTNVQTLCWSKSSPSLSNAHSSCISRSINTIFVPHMGMYIRINIISRFGAIVSHFVRGDILFYSPCISEYERFLYVDDVSRLYMSGDQKKGSDRLTMQSCSWQNINQSKNL